VEVAAQEGARRSFAGPVLFSLARFSLREAF
jgi:hypothetical protein